MFPRPLIVPLAATVLLLGGAAALAQPKGKVGTYSDVTVEGSILEPEKIEISDEAELAGLIKAPDGFKVEVFARDLVNPRMLAVSPKGVLYATRRSVGDVVMIQDGDGDGKAETVKTVASRSGMHGIAFDGEQVFLVTVNDVYVADVKDDGSFGELKRIINDLPDGGQHPNRTIGIGPDGMLYISVGSTCNACAETNPESATILRASKDGKSRAIFAKGLRNTIGFDWEPSSGALYGIDHGIDWLGDQAQIEELNLVEQGKQYGWPYIYGMDEFNPQDNPPEGMTLEQWAKLSTEPLLGYTAHSAPMQMAFHDGAGLPEQYRGDAFVAMRGSWNRRPPSGYEVVRINFEDGRPVGFEHFLEGFLIEKESGGYGYLARLAGLAAGSDGAIYVADDSGGVIYRVTYEGKAKQNTTASVSVTTPNPVADPPASKIAIELVEASTDHKLEVKSSFGNGERIPHAHSADGDNASPRLEWSGAPAETKSFVIIVDDPDAAKPKPFVHWIAYDLPASIVALREGLPTEPVLPDPEIKQGTNSAGSTGYQGPKPPVGDLPHNYHFQIFALDLTSLGLEPGARREEVLSAMQGHVVAEGELVGKFQRPGEAEAR